MNSRRRVLILVDQATRDTVSQLLVAHYLRRNGIEPLICNQATLVSTYERYRPPVAFVSWASSGTLVEYLQSISDRTHLVLMDQEGGRLGEAAFKRALRWGDALKTSLAPYAARVVAWGPSQAQWLRDLDVATERQIVITGCPRLDPYLVRGNAGEEPRRYIGVTLRGDGITAHPDQVMQSALASWDVKPEDGLTPSLPPRATFEDWIWGIVAVHRHMFKVIKELTRATTTPIVVRPGPWEQSHVYDFLARQFPQVTVQPQALQHQYIQGARVTVDASSALGLEALVAGIPVVSINSLVPRLEEHVGSPDGGRLNAPYRACYWEPQTIEAAVERIVEADRGHLALTPDPDGMKRYLAECHSWPNNRPASFNIGDMLLDLLEIPPGTERRAQESVPNPIAPVKRRVYRIPGATAAVKSAQLARFHLLSRDRRLYRRYFYFDWTWSPRHHAEVRRLFEALWTTYEPASPRRTAH